MNCCGEHSGVVTRIEQLDRQVSDLFGKYNEHCNGGGKHLYRPEHDRIEEDRTKELSAMTECVRKFIADVDRRMKAAEERMAAAEQERAVQAAGLSRGDKMLLAVLTTLGPLAAAGIALLGK